MAAAASREEWKWIHGYIGLYRVSNLGRILSVPRVVRCKNGYRTTPKIIVSPVKQSNGYMTVSLYRNGAQKVCTVHRLVAKAFLPNKQNKPEVGHKDNAKDNNQVSNLEWVTRSENEFHSYRTGHKKPTRKPRPDIMGMKNWNAKLSDKDVTNILKRIALGETQASIARDLGLHRCTVSRIHLGLRKITYCKE